jgi:TldD protein
MERALAVVRSARRIRTEPTFTQRMAGAIRPLSRSLRSRRLGRHRRSHRREAPRRRPRARGDYADLFFEYRAAGGFVFDEGILKSASRGRVDGPRGSRPEGGRHGVRLRRAARLGRHEAGGRHGGADRDGGGAKTPVHQRGGRACPPLRARPGDARRARRRQARAARARGGGAHAFDPRRRQGRGEPRGGDPRDPGRHERRQDGARRQPLVRFGVRVIAEKNGKRQEGSSGGGGRTSLGYFEGKSPEWHATRGRASRPSRCSTRRRRPRDRWRSSSRRATAASSCTRPSATASRPTSTARGRATTPARSAAESRASLCTVVDDATLLQSRGHDQRRRRGQRAARSVLIENGQARRLHARPPERRSTTSSARAATAAARASRARRCRG